LVSEKAVDQTELEAYRAEEGTQV